MGQEGKALNKKRICEISHLSRSPCIVDSSLTKDPERNPHASQELSAELQIAGVPQVDPEHKPEGTVDT